METLFNGTLVVGGRDQDSTGFAWLAAAVSWVRLNEVNIIVTGISGVLV